MKPFTRLGRVYLPHHWDPHHHITSPPRPGLSRRSQAPATLPPGTPWLTEHLGRSKRRRSTVPNPVHGGGVRNEAARWPGGLSHGLPGAPVGGIGQSCASDPAPFHKALDAAAAVSSHMSSSRSNCGDTMGPRSQFGGPLPPPGHPREPRCSPPPPPLQCCMPLQSGPGPCLPICSAPDTDLCYCHGPRPVNCIALLGHADSLCRAPARLQISTRRA